MKSIQKSSELCQIRPEPPPSLTFRRRSKSMSRRPSVKGLRFKLLYNFDKLIFALSFSKIIVKKTSIKSDKSFNIYTIAETHFALNCGHRPKLSVASQEDAWETLLFRDKDARKNIDMGRYCRTKINRQKWTWIIQNWKIFWLIFKLNLKVLVNMRTGSLRQGVRGRWKNMCS